MIVSSFNEKKNNSVVICLGGFDSMHLGHQLLISKAVHIKKELNIDSAILTYDNDFGIISGKNKGLVFTFPERLKILEKYAIDEVCVAHFDERFATLSPLEFLHELCDNRHIEAFICGKDFKFGKNGKGNIETLSAFCAERKIKLEVVDFLLDENEVKISTSTIKDFLQDGNIEKANKLLGYSYFVMGKVVEGRKVGRQLGFPTANIEFSSEKFLPKLGVYKTSVQIDGKEYNAITNVGSAPTFGVECNLIECYIDGFSGDLYGKQLTVNFHSFIREIQKFSSVDLLIKQLEKDLMVIR